MEELEEIVFKEQYKVEQKYKEELLLNILKPQLENNEKNIYMKSMYEKLSFEINKDIKLKDIPFIPVNMFKYFKLVTCNENEITRVLKSSATTEGISSIIYVDKKTSIRQSQALISILKSFIGSNRRPLLILDTENINKQNASLSARGAAVRGISTFAKKITYVMKEENNNLILDEEKLIEFVKMHANDEVLVYGFTYIIWSKVIEILKNKGIKLQMPNIKILHSGGWKKLQSQSVSKEQFCIDVAKCFGTAKKNVIDFYGMIEQVGVVFIDCECGYKHVPDFADIILRDPFTLEEVNVGETGLIEVISCLPSSYPGQAVLTEDIGEFIGVDDCKCGRKGKYFKFKRRMDKVEVRGCGDTFAEKEKNI